VLTDADGPHVELRPEDLEPAAAAALVEPGLTAQTIVRAAGVQSGRRALVVGATGAVGMLLVPLLAEVGASVIADDSAGDAIEALRRHPDVDLVVDLVSFDEPYLLMAHAVPSCGALVGSLPEPEAGGPGLPRIQVCAEPGDLLDLAQRAPAEILDVDAVEADLVAAMAGQATADGDLVTIAA
jgi:NAD(P)-dependent dehydrogenase (short-subunit alcohol dehydrogenase family)